MKTKTIGKIFNLIGVIGAMTSLVISIYVLDLAKEHIRQESGANQAESGKTIKIKVSNIALKMKKAAQEKSPYDPYSDPNFIGSGVNSYYFNPDK